MSKPRPAILTSHNEQEILVVRFEGVLTQKKLEVAVRVCAEKQNVEVTGVDLNELIYQLIRIRDAAEESADYAINS